MKNNAHELEKTIKTDIETPKGVVRHFESGPETKTQTIISYIVRLAPSSVIMRQSALRELGRSAILLNIENTLKSFANNQSAIRFDPHLHNLLKTHIHPDK